MIKNTLYFSRIDMFLLKSDAKLDRNNALRKFNQEIFP